MVRRIFLSSALVLLVSCAQNPTVAPAPTPTVLSTDLSDMATSVATDLVGNAYVAGYRDASRRADQSGDLGEIFVGRFDVSGSLRWLTSLAIPATYDFDPRVALAEKAIYVITTDNAIAAPYTLHKLRLDGTLLWSKRYFSAGEKLQGFAVTPDERFYISRETANYEVIISAFDSTGAVQWEEVTSPGSYGLVAASDGSLYEANDYRVSKRAADGTLQWTKSVIPSLPYSDDETYRYVSLYVREDSLYAVATFLEQERSVNKEVTRLNSRGEKAWSHLLIPRREPYPECDYLSEHCLGILGISADGAFYASRGDVLIRISATGERVETDELTWYGDYPAAQTMARITLPEVGPTDIFYEVGTTGVDEVYRCEDNSEAPGACAPTDIYVQQSSLNQISNEDGSLADVYKILMWSSR